MTYTTGQIAELFRIHPNTVRYYEEMGFISQPQRTSTGRRIFTPLHKKLRKRWDRMKMIENYLEKGFTAPW